MYRADSSSVVLFNTPLYITRDPLVARTSCFSQDNFGRRQHPDSLDVLVSMFSLSQFSWFCCSGFSLLLSVQYLAQSFTVANDLCCYFFLTPSWSFQNLLLRFFCCSSQNWRHQPPQTCPALVICYLLHFDSCFC